MEIYGYKLTKDELSVEPLNPIILWITDEDFVAENGNGDQQHRTQCNRKRESTEKESIDIYIDRSN